MAVSNVAQLWAWWGQCQCSSSRATARRSGVRYMGRRGGEAARGVTAHAAQAWVGMVWCTPRGAIGQRHRRHANRLARTWQSRCRRRRSRRSTSPPVQTRRVKKRRGVGFGASAQVNPDATAAREHGRARKRVRAVVRSRATGASDWVCAGYGHGGRAQSTRAALPKNKVAASGSARSPGGAGTRQWGR